MVRAFLGNLAAYAVILVTFRFGVAWGLWAFVCELAGVALLDVGARTVRAVLPRGPRAKADA